MKNFYILIAVLIVVASILFFRSEIVGMFSGSGPVVQGTSSGDVTLDVGETGKVGSVTITFNAPVQDSRCPIDVVCIQAGAVNTNVTLTNANRTATRNISSDEIPYQFDDSKISIVSINPPRESNKEIPPTLYRVTFHIAN